MFKADLLRGRKPSGAFGSLYSRFSPLFFRHSTCSKSVLAMVIEARVPVLTHSFSNEMTLSLKALVSHEVEDKCSPVAQGMRI